MSTIVSNCPRCKAKSMTFDILADVHMGTQYDWQHWHELTARCRHCERPSLMLVSLHKIEYKNSFGKDGSITALGNTDIANFFRFERVITTADLAANDAPEFLPENIDRAFKEGTRCLAIGCHNAAAAMFRLCLDLATKDLLPGEEPPEGPSKRERFSLGHRLEWLFERGILPVELEDLSAAVKGHGDDGAHEGVLDATDADDLYDFAFALLDRLYTQPARLEEAKARRAERKAKAAEPQ